MICPTCKRSFTPAREGAADPAARPAGPFCSARCRLADLGSWLDGAYRIPTASDDEDLDAGARGEGDESDPSN